MCEKPKYKWARFAGLDMCQAALAVFAVHFDFSFPAGTKAMVVNTSPWHPTTHWKQTVLHINQHLPVHPADYLHSSSFIYSLYPACAFLRALFLMKALILPSSIYPPELEMTE